MRRELRTDEEIAALAARQHGVLARRQLSRLGLEPGVIERRIARGWLHPLHRGTYAVGHRRVSREGRWMAAVLAVGDDAALSHRDGAALWGIRPSSRRIVEVTAPRRVPSRPGIHVHFALLPADEVTEVDGIPVTIVPRTLLDLAAVRGVREVERAVHEAEVRQLWDALSLGTLLERYPRRHGTRAVRTVLAAMGNGSKVTRSDFEAAFLDFVEDERLPRPEVNAIAEAASRTFEADFLWRERRLIVEADGRAVHRTVRNFETDRERDRLLQVAGWRVVRITWRQLHDGRRALARDLRALLDG